MASEKIKHKIPMGWASVASSARRQIEECRARIASLKLTIKIAEKKAKEGEPWPVSSGE